ncbi:MAG TPA: hypothetical protein VMA09_10805 [Candidatus Binataceae bacterium]|nr:hypothetical protein [Candidatus Binataceae bacterium]
MSTKLGSSSRAWIGFAPVALAGLFVAIILISAGCGGSSGGPPPSVTTATATPTVTPTATPTPVASLDKTQMANAAPDECFYGVGDPNNLYPAVNVCPPPSMSNQLKINQLQTTPPTTPNKVNESYVWGLTEAGTTLWLGTSQNTLCLVIGNLLSAVALPLDPIETDSYVCEFGDSVYGTAHMLPAAIADTRPPGIFTFDTTTSTLTDVTPSDPLIANTVGLRSAGNLGGVAFLAGQSLTGGINMFAFNATTDAYIGSQNFPQYSDIRSWVVLGTQLYAGVQNTATRTGSVLKWTGTVALPFQFVDVGDIDNEAANLAAHQGRIFVTTWTGFGTGTTTNYAGLWMSPVAAVGGLTNADAANWQELWKVNFYDPDGVTAHTVVGGALASFDGFLYWGTLQVPLSGVAEHYQAFPPPSFPPIPSDFAMAILGTQRPIAIFRCCGTTLTDVDPQPATELLYGDAELPVYGGGQWFLVPNNMGGNPGEYGPAGFGNVFNAYTWSMATFNNNLYIGTFDWSIVIATLADSVTAETGIRALQTGPNTVQSLSNFFNNGFFANNIAIYAPGADIWRFQDDTSPAVAETLDGLGNPFNYGIRTMVADANALWMGTANPFNLEIPDGGWELWQGVPITP